MKDLLLTADVSWPLTAFEKLLVSGEMRKLLSRIYQILIDSDQIEDWSHRAWCKDLAFELSDSQWRAINLRGHKVSRNITIQEHCYKVLHHWYWSPERVAKSFPSVSLLCWHCGGKGAIFHHNLWDCPEIRVYWQMVTYEVERILGRKIPFTSRVYLLHDF